MSRYDGSIDMEMADFLRYSGVGRTQTSMAKFQLDLEKVEKLIRESANEAGRFLKPKTKQLIEMLRIPQPENVSANFFYDKMANVSLNVVQRYVDRFDPEKSMFKNLPGYDSMASYAGTDEIYDRYQKTAECLKDYQRDLDRHTIAKACVLLGKPVSFDHDYNSFPVSRVHQGMTVNTARKCIERNNGNFAPSWTTFEMDEKIKDCHKCKSGLFMIEFADRVYVSEDISVHYYKYYKEYEEAQRMAEKMKDPEFAANKAKTIEAMKDISEIINSLDQQSKGTWLSQFGNLPHKPSYGGPDISDMATFVGYTPEIFADASEHAHRVYRTDEEQYTYNIAKYVKDVIEACSSNGIPIIQTCDSTLANSNVNIEARNPGVPLGFIDFVIDQLPAPGTTFELPAGSKFIGEYAGCEELTHGMECKVLEVSGSGREFAILTDKGLITSCDMDTIYRSLTLARAQELKGLDEQTQESDLDIGRR